jgi:hypothetical protein
MKSTVASRQDSEKLERIRDRADRLEAILESHRLNRDDVEDGMKD